MPLQSMNKKLVVHQINRMTITHIIIKEMVFIPPSPTRGGKGKWLCKLKFIEQQTCMNAEIQLRNQKKGMSKEQHGLIKKQLLCYEKQW